MTTRNYELLDRKRNIKFKSEKLKIAQEHGYTYITEAIESLYEKVGPVATAEMMELTVAGVYMILKYIGVELNLKQRGGRHNTKLNAEKVKSGRAIWNGRVDAEYIKALMIVLEVDVSDNCLRAALKGVDTWRDVE